jgi:hypothetical protein
MAFCMAGCGGADSQTADCAIEGFKTARFQVPGGQDMNPAAQMSVFRRSAQAPDTLPPELTGLRFDEDELAAPARVLPRRSRLLVTAPRSRVRLYAVPTTNGNVCFQVTRTLENSCSLAGRFNLMAVDQGGPHRCIPTHVVGIVPDRVRAVDVVVHGRARRAHLGGNGFIYELRPAFSPSAITAIALTLRNGARTEIDL